MRMPTALLTRRHRPAAPKGEFPYGSPVPPPQAVEQALSESDALEFMHQGRPQPSFTARSHAAPTAPLPVLSEKRLPGPVTGTARKWEAPERDVMLRVHAGLLASQRAERFLADKRDLPAFAAVTRIAGWQGLHTVYRGATHERWTTERWFFQALGAIHAAVDAAKEDVQAQVDAARDQLAWQWTEADYARRAGAR